MLRTIFLLGLLTVGCMAFGQNYNAEKVDRPNTKKINFGIGRIQLFHVPGVQTKNQGCDYR